MLQLGLESLHDNVLLSLLYQTASELAFNVLRTKEQLGTAIGAMCRH